MFVSYIEESRPTMQQLQCLKLLKKQLEKDDRRNEAAIARELAVNRSTISRYLRQCVVSGIITEDSCFTRKGLEILDFYTSMEHDLQVYFEKIGIKDEACYEAMAGMMNSMDIRTIQTICQKEKLHMQYENLGAVNMIENREISWSKIGSHIRPGIYEVDFSVYRQGKDFQKLSMADAGFQKPAILAYLPDRYSYLELTIRELQACNKQGELFHGHVQSVKCCDRDDGLKQLRIQDGRIRIPLEEFVFEELNEEEIMAQIQLTMTSNIGERNMPESVATVVVRM